MTVVMAWKLTFPVMRFAAPASTPPLNGRQSLRLRGRGCRVGRAMLTATLVPQFPPNASPIGCAGRRSACS